LQIRSSDEVGDLGNAFNSMAQKLDALITELKDTEETLRESEKKYRNLADNALVGIFISTAKGDVVYVNETLTAAASAFWQRRLKVRMRGQQLRL
jgi:PAS domain-containing protein